MPLYPSNEAEEDENPLLALLDAEDEETETVSFIPPSDEDEESPRKSKQNDEIAERLARLEQENERLRTQIPANNSNMQQYAYVPPVAHVPQASNGSGLFPNTSNQEAAQQEINLLNEKFARNPGEALREVYLQGQRAAEEAQKRNLYPVAIQNAKFAINQFAASSNMDADTREEFNKLVGTFTPEQLAQANPTQIEAQLELVRKIAKANVVEAKEKANKRAQNPPPFGSSGGSGGKAAVSVKLNKIQKAAWELGKQQGLSDKDLYDLYKKGDLD